MKIPTIYKDYITPQRARLLFYVTTVIGIFYHILILTQIVNFRYAWGGRLQSLEQMYIFETVSWVSILPFILVVALHARANKNSKTFIITKYLLFGISLLFLVNTVGNLFASTAFEAIVFTPMTLIAALSTFRLAIEN